MSKQTALQWFIEQLTQVNKNSINKPSLQLNRSLSGDKLKEIIEQALEMEYDQMGGAFISGGLNWETPLTFSEYLKETYGGQNEWK